MNTLHALFTLRNQQAFQRLLESSKNAQTASQPPLSTSGGKSWNRPSTLSSPGFPPCDINARDWLGRTVLHLAVSSLDPAALEYVKLLLSHPRIDINITDLESRWSALHRALYAGNLSASVLLLQRSDVDVSLKDSEGYTAFDLYNSTVEGTKPDGVGDAELFTWGVNRNAALGHGDGDDRAFPDLVVIQPQREYSNPEKRTLSERFDSISAKQIVMSKLHTAVVTNEARSNMRICGFGSGGRLGSNQHTQYTLVPMAQLQYTITSVSLGQDHTLALTSNGDVLSWGLNRFSQLGYVVEASSSGLPSRAFSQAEEPIQAIPRRVYGPLKKEIVRGVAACKTASACWTETEVFTWGTNSGQLGYDKVVQPAQILPRKVTHVTQPVIDIALTDTAMACLLESKDVLCFWNNRNFKINFPTQNFPSEIQAYRPPMAQNNANIAKIVSCDHTFAALSSNGEMFTFSLNPPSSSNNLDAQSREKSLVKPQRVWALRKQFSAVRDMDIGSDGTIILCTESGHTYVRSRNAVVMPKGPFPVNIGPTMTNPSFKFQRIPFLQRVVKVTTNSTGAFGALRMDVRPVPIKLEGNSLAEDLATVRPFLIAIEGDGLDGIVKVAVETQPPPPASGASTVPPVTGTSAENDDESEDASIQADVRSISLLCGLLRSDRESRRDNGFGIYHKQQPKHGADLWIHVGDSFSFPAHSLILASRSAHLNEVLLGKMIGDRNISVGRMAPTNFKVSDTNLNNHLTFSRVHPLSVLLFVSYLYTDELLALWDLRIGTALENELASLTVTPSKVREELQILAGLCSLQSLSIALESHIKREPTPTLSRDLQVLLLNSQPSPNRAVKHNINQPLCPDVILDLADKRVYCHSTLLRSRSPFFQSFFDDEIWTSKRQEQDDCTIILNLRHMKWREMDYVIRYIYCGGSEDLFSVLEFTRNVDDVLDFMFHVMAVASELLLDRLHLICSSVILRYANITNICYLLSEATFYSAKQLVISLQSYMARNMESLLESRMLDDLPDFLVKQLAFFVRLEQAKKLPLTRSNRLVEEALVKHAQWLETQDIPTPIVRNAKALFSRQKSPRLSPVLTGKKNRRQSFTTNVQPLPLPLTPPVDTRPRFQSPLQSAMEDEVFLMDDEQNIPPLNLAAVQPTASASTSSVDSINIQSSPWKTRIQQLPSKVDLRSIMAEAEGQKTFAPSPAIQRAQSEVGQPTSGVTATLSLLRNASGQGRTVTPPKLIEAVETAAPHSTSPSRSKVQGPWKLPVAPSQPSSTSASHFPRTPVETLRNTPPSGISRALRGSPNQSPLSTRTQSNSLATVNSTAIAGPSKVKNVLGPTFTPSRNPAIPIASNLSRRVSDTPGNAWVAAPTVQHLPEVRAPSSTSPPSFLAIQEQQREQTMSKPPPKKSLREIQEEERAKQEEQDFMRWWAAEEQRIKSETQASSAAQPDQSNKAKSSTRRKAPFKGAMTNKPGDNSIKQDAAPQRSESSRPKRGKGRSSVVPKSSS